LNHGAIGLGRIKLVQYELFRRHFFVLVMGYKTSIV